MPQDAQGQEPTMESAEAATEGAEDLGMLDDVGRLGDCELIRFCQICGFMWIQLKLKDQKVDFKCI